jgi:hypothetical protein
MSITTLLLAFLPAVIRAKPDDGAVAKLKLDLEVMTSSRERFRAEVDRLKAEVEVERALALLWRRQALGLRIAAQQLQQDAAAQQMQGLSQRQSAVNQFGQSAVNQFGLERDCTPPLGLAGFLLGG